MHKIAFVTCVELGLACLNTLNAYKNKINLKYLVSLKDENGINKSGRIYLDKFAKENQVPLFKVSHINELPLIENNLIQEIDYLFIIGWSQIASQSVLSIPKIMTIGAHPTKLPIGKGRAPIPWTIIKGLENSAVSFFTLDTNVDNGPILHQENFSIDSINETSTTLYKKVYEYHANGFKKILNKIIDLNLEKIPQIGPSSKWPKRTNEDGQISSKLTINQIKKLIRAQQKPYPLSFIKKDNKIYEVNSFEGMKNINNTKSNLKKIKFLALDGYLNLYIDNAFDF